MFECALPEKCGKNFANVHLSDICKRYIHKADAHLCQGLSVWPCADGCANSSSALAAHLDISPVQTPPSLHSERDSCVTMILVLYWLYYRVKSGCHGNSNPHPHFTDGMSMALVGPGLTESDAVELALVQIDHRPLTSLLTDRAARFYTVLEHVSRSGQKNGCVNKNHHRKKNTLFFHTCE